MTDDMLKSLKLTKEDFLTMQKMYKIMSTCPAREIVFSYENTDGSMYALTIKNPFFEESILFSSGVFTKL